MRAEVSLQDEKDGVPMQRELQRNAPDRAGDPGSTIT